MVIVYLDLFRKSSIYENCLMMETCLFPLCVFFLFQQITLMVFHKISLCESVPPPTPPPPQAVNCL